MILIHINFLGSEISMKRKKNKDEMKICSVERVAFCIKVNKPTSSDDFHFKSFRAKACTRSSIPKYTLPECFTLAV